MVNGPVTAAKGFRLCATFVRALLRGRPASRRLRVFLVALVCLCSPWAAIGQDIRDDVNFLGRLAPSPNGRLIAAYAPGAPDLWLITCCAPYKTLFHVGATDLEKFNDHPLVMDAAWSSDGKLLKIDVYDGDEYTVVVTLDPVVGPTSLKAVETGHGVAEIAEWAKAGHRLYAAPDKGLYVVDLDRGTSTPLFKDQRVTSNIVILPDGLLMRLADEQFGPYSLVAVDLRGGRKTVLVRKEPAEVSK